MKDTNNSYDISKLMLENIRKMDKAEKRKQKTAKLLREDKAKKESIAITNEPKFGQNVLQNQIDSFRQTVNNGARFASEDAEHPENNPLVYFPNTGNLVFSGSIPVMSGLKFQYSLNDVTNAPYIFVNGLALTEDVIETLTKLRGHYLNWKDEFLETGDQLDKLDELE